MYKIILIFICCGSITFAENIYEVKIEPYNCNVHLTVRSGQTGKGETLDIKQIKTLTTKDISMVVKTFENSFTIHSMVYADSPGAIYKIQYLKNKNIVSESTYSDFPGPNKYIGGWKTGIQLICVK